MTTAPEERSGDFRGTFGLRRGVARQFDALLAGEDSDSARHETTSLIAYVQRGDNHDALAVLGQANADQLALGHLRVLVDAVIERASSDARERWHFSLMQAGDMFGMATADESGKHELDDRPWDEFLAEFHASALSEMRRALSSVPRVPLTRAWLEQEADTTLRHSLVFAVSSELARRGRTPVEQLASNWLQEVSDENASRVIAKLDQIAWHPLIDAWVSKEPLNAAAWLRYLDERESLLADFKNELADKLNDIFRA